MRNKQEEQAWGTSMSLQILFCVFRLLIFLYPTKSLAGVFDGPQIVILLKKEKCFNKYWSQRPQYNIGKLGKASTRHKPDPGQKFALLSKGMPLTCNFYVSYCIICL